jgi:lysyl-tRNA synthetase class 2
MIAGGFDRVFTLTQNFREGEAGPWHNPEFTMLEWARAFETLEAIEGDAARFIRSAFSTLYPGEGALRYDGRQIDLLGPWERLSVRDAIEIHLGVAVDADFTPGSMREGCARAGLALPAGVDSDPLELLTGLLVELQPKLGWRAPTFLCEWPSFMTSSAGLSSRDPRIAERSELFIAGIEIADGFPSLRDPATQRETFARELARRRAAGKAPVGLDERYLEALEQGLPPGAGMALGVDRLVMVLTGARELRQVLTFAWDEL